MFSTILQRPISAGDRQSIDFGRQLWDVAAPLADSCRKRATPPAFSAWPESAAHALGAGLAALGGALPVGDVFCLSFPWGAFGPLRLDPRWDLDHAMDLARSRAQECAVCAADGRDGFWLEYEPVLAVDGDPYPFELVVWGAWHALAREVLPFELAAQ